MSQSLPVVFNSLKRCDSYKSILRACTAILFLIGSYSTIQGQCVTCADDCEMLVETPIPTTFIEGFDSGGNQTEEGQYGLSPGADNAFVGVVLQADPAISGYTLDELCVTGDLVLSGADPADFPMTLEFRIENACGAFPCSWIDFFTEVTDNGSYSIGGLLSSGNAQADMGALDPAGSAPQIVLSIVNFDGSPVVGSPTVNYSNIQIVGATCEAIPDCPPASNCAASIEDLSVTSSTICVGESFDILMDVAGGVMATGTDNLEYFIVQEDPNNSNILQWPIIGVTEWQLAGVDPAGGYDFSTAPVGNYAMLPIAYSQSELDATTFNPVAGGVIGAQGGESLNELVALFPNITSVPIPDPLTVEAVVGVVTSATIAAIIGFDPCIAVNVNTTIPFSVEECTAACEAAISGTAEDITICSPADNTSVMNNATFTGTGADNLEYFVLQPDDSNPNILQWEILGVTEWEFDGVSGDGGFDFANAAPGTYTILPIAFSQSEIDATTFNPVAGGVIGASGGESLSELVLLFPNITSVPIPDPLTVETVVGVVTSATIAAIIGFDPCIGLNPASSFSLTVEECTSACAAEIIGGVPPFATCAPASEADIQGAMNFTGQGADNLEYFVLQPDGSNPNILQWTILGVTEWQFDGVQAGGGFDFTTAAAGGYAVLPIAFSQSELDATTFNPVAGGVIGAQGGESLAELVALFPNITSVPIPDPLTVEAVLGVVTSATIGAIIGFDPCVAVNTTSFLELNITACGGAVDCEGVTDGPATPGTACDDGNPDTENDVYLADCTCAGTAVGGGTCISVSVDTQTVYACAGGEVCVMATVSDQGPNDVTAYILHTEEVPTPDTVIGQSIDCTFSIGDIAGGTTNTLYYISAVASTDDNGNGTPDFGEACFTVASGGTAVFLDPVVVDATDVFCDESTFVTSINYSITGGLPGYDSQATYTLTGDINGNSVAGVINTVEYSDGELFGLTATDAAGCSAGASGGPIECAKLPVEYLYVQGEETEEGNLIQWATSIEIDSDYFELARSRDGQSFDTVQILSASGNSLEVNEYEYLDTDVSCGDTYFYRLNQIDFNGKNNIHNELIRIQTESCGISITDVSPVPAETEVFINVVSGVASTVSVELYDVTGKILLSKQIFVDETESTAKLDVSEFATGIYFISVNNDRFRQTSRLIIK